FFFFFKERCTTRAIHILFVGRVRGVKETVHNLGYKYVIQDLGSTNGIFINGKKVKQQVLKADDVITIGQHQMKCAFKVSEKTGEIVKPRPTSTGTGASLKILSGKEAGTRITLNEALTTIGEPGIQVAAVSKRPQGYFIIHVDGGKDRERVPLVNGEPTGFKSRKLEPGDKIEVAGIQMEYSER
ncbi:MAG: FHA domain-containing protein, partial [Pseudomonadales bacterium]|nr:FHA domain-containing protein [Pseudomonadales bacterium]